MSNWILVNVEEVGFNFAHSFSIPSESIRNSLKPGDYAKLIFQLKNSKIPNDKPIAERMWVIVKKITKNGYEGTLDNDPQVISGLIAGGSVSFNKQHIIDIQ